MTITRHRGLLPQRRSPRKPRRGVAVLIVLAILAITLALSYSVMRSQVTAVQIQHNARRRDEARQAAQAGVQIALRRMYEANWMGVDAGFSGQVGANCGFNVTYATGDDSLTAGDADYDEWPYRVTILSTGYALDPANPQLQSTHRIRAVAQLTRRRRADTPNDWSTVQSYTVYQWKPHSDLSLSRFEVEYPSRIDGHVRLQGALSLCAAYPDYAEAAERLMNDLNSRRSLGLGDQRPLTGRVDLDYSFTPSATLSLLWTNLGVATSDTSQSNAADWEIGARAVSYRLYPGGKEYAARKVGGSLENIALKPDPQTNPLGIYYHSGAVELRDNVTICGTLFAMGDADGDVRINGTNIQLTGADLAPLEDAVQPARLPVIVAGRRLRILGGASVKIDGMAIVGDEFIVDQADQASTVLHLRGRLMCQELIINGRNEWAQSSSWYQSRLYEFYFQLTGLSPTLYFPDFLEEHYGLTVQPKIVLEGPAAPVSYHWQDAANPLFAPHPNDEALVWDLVDWRNLP